MDHAARMARVQEALTTHELDAFLISDLTNVRYLTGFSGTNGQVLVSTDRLLFLSDPRYEARAKAMVEGAEISIYQSRLTDVLKPALEEGAIRRLGVEAKTMTLADRDDLG